MPRRKMAALTAVLAGGIPLYAVVSRVEGPGRTMIGNALIVVAPVVGFVSTMAAWRRTRERAWLLLGLFCALWASGQVLWAYYELIVHQPVLFPSFADVGYLGGAAFAVAASTQLPRRTTLPAALAAIDGLVVALSLVIIGVAALGPIITAGDAAQRWLAIAYPASDAAVLTAMVTALPGVAPRWRPQVLYVVAGFTAIAMADVAFAVLTSSNSYQTGSPIDLGWVAGFALIAVGAARASRAGATTCRKGAERNGRSALLLPHIAVVPAAAAVLATQLTHPRVDPILIYLGVSVVPLTAGRHVLTLLESERRANALHHEMTYDALTGLWNRRTLSRALDQLTSGGDNIAVVVIDIDDFKNVNDGAGPSVGDTVLREAARRIRRSITDSDLIARVGGDEFAVVLRDASHTGDVINSVVRLCDAFSAPFSVGPMVRKLTVSVGIATDLGDDSADLLRNADIAMYAAKRRGKNCYAHFEPDFRADAVERIELISNLEYAVGRDEFVVEYQPIFRLHDTTPVGAEALIRWRHPTRGLLQPSQFMPLAEGGPHIEEIGEWVLRRAAQFIARLRADGAADEDFYIAVNVAARQLYAGRFVNTIDRILTETGLPGSALVIELTESSLIDIDIALPALSAIRARGVRLAVDDFGTGYSSLSYLHRLPLDILKIDRSFVAHVDQSVERRAMTKAIITLGRSLGLATVAEGVERPAQLRELRTHGCASAQGYLWSPPVPEQEFIDLLVRHRSSRAVSS